MLVSTVESSDVLIAMLPISVRFAKTNNSNPQALDLAFYAPLSSVSHAINPKSALFTTPLPVIH